MSSGNGSTARGPRVRSTASSRDIALIGALPLTAILAWAVPERCWPGVSAGLARLNRRSRGHRRLAAMKRILTFAGERELALPPDVCVGAHLTNIYLQRLQLLRCYRPGGWRPRITLMGRAHLEAALAAGKGAILWVAPLSFSSLVTKIALHDAGFAVSHLTRTTHGFSNTRLGIRLLNPVQTAIEGRYLAERVVFGDGGPTAALRQLSRCLRHNGIVSITVGSKAERAERIPFMDGEIELAAGPIDLMRRSSAALLPVFTAREADGSFTTAIEPPLTPPDEGHAAPATQALLRRYTILLEAYASRYPDQFAWHGGLIRTIAPFEREGDADAALGIE